MVVVGESELISELKVIKESREGEFLVDLFSVLIKKPTLLLSTEFIALNDSVHKWRGDKFLNRIKSELFLNWRAQKTSQYRMLVFLLNFFLKVIQKNLVQWITLCYQRLYQAGRIIVSTLFCCWFLFLAYVLLKFHYLLLYCVLTLKKESTETFPFLVLLINKNVVNALLNLYLLQENWIVTQVSRHHTALSPSILRRFNLFKLILNLADNSLHEQLLILSVVWQLLNTYKTTIV